MNTILVNEISHDIIQVIDKSSKSFNFIAVTGTNAKSSVTYLIKRILQYLGRCVRIEDTIESTSLLEFAPSSLKYHRINMYNFDIGVFTDLKQYQENNNESIMNLFKVCEIGIVNADNEILQRINKYAPFQTITYGINNPADLMAKDIKYSQDGISFKLDFQGLQKIVKLNTFNKFNIYNSLAAVEACYFLGLPLNIIIEGLNHIKIFN